MYLFTYFKCINAKYFRFLDFYRLFCYVNSTEKITNWIFSVRRSLRVIRVVLLVPCLWLSTSPRPAAALCPVLLPRPLCPLHSPAQPAPLPLLSPAHVPITATTDLPLHLQKHPATVRNTTTLALGTTAVLLLQMIRFKNVEQIYISRYNLSFQS